MFYIHKRQEVHVETKHETERRVTSTDNKDSKKIYKKNKKIKLARKLSFILF